MQTEKNGCLTIPVVREVVGFFKATTELVGGMRMGFRRDAGVALDPEKYKQFLQLTRRLHERNR